MRFTVATYNIHKGFTQLNRRMVIHELRERLAGLDADILFLQEVIGVHERHAARHRDWPAKPQHEFIADQSWHEVAYGRTAITRHGHHGNAVLSRYPISTHENLDISAHAFESRGLLHCEIKLGPRSATLHCINVHLGLFERGRQQQIAALCARIRAQIARICCWRPRSKSPRWTLMQWSDGLRGPSLISQWSKPRLSNACAEMSRFSCAEIG